MKKTLLDGLNEDKRRVNVLGGRLVEIIQFEH